MNFHNHTPIPMVLPAPVEKISGQAIAKSSTWSPRYRAKLAAKWVRALLDITPTIKLAAMVFGVSVPLVMDALKELDEQGAKTNGAAAAAGHELASAILRASPAERLAAARVVGVDLIWDSMIAPTIT